MPQFVTAPLCTFATEITKTDIGDLGKLQTLKLYLVGISDDGQAAMMIPMIKDSGTCNGDSGGAQFLSGQNSPIIIGILSRGLYGNIPYCIGAPKIIELLEPNLKLLSRFAREAMGAQN